MPGTTLAEIDYLNQLKSAIGLDDTNADEEDNHSSKTDHTPVLAPVKKQTRRLSMQDVTDKYKPDGDQVSREEERHIAMMLHPGEFVILRGTVWKRAVSSGPV